MRSILIWIVVGVAICVVGYVGYTYRQSTQIPSYTPPPTEPPGKGVVGNEKLDKDPFNVTIDYTDAGFNPTNITVAQGTRVRFINHSSAQFWPASGIHPTHTLYPEKEPTDCLGSSFDACTTVAPGEFFDFTFYYIGQWPFHDHLKAYNTGTITVTASSTTQ